MTFFEAWIINTNKTHKRPSAIELDGVIYEL